MHIRIQRSEFLRKEALILAKKAKGIYIIVTIQTFR
jgi:hypothetical protein